MRKSVKLFSVLTSLLTVMVFSMASVFAAPMTGNGTGQVNWEDGTVTVIGMGVPSSRAKSKIQARMMARRAAIVDGYRQLAEMVKGVIVNVIENCTCKSVEIPSTRAF